MVKLKNSKESGKLLEDVIISPHKGKKESSVTETVIMIFSPSDFERTYKLIQIYHPILLPLDNFKLFQLKPFYSPKNFCIAGPALGAPMAVLLLEKLIALGAKNILTLGCCGSLQKELTIGSFLIPTIGISEEGTSAHYPIRGKTPCSSSFINLKIQNQFVKMGKEYVLGGVWTTDAPYRETTKKVLKYQKMGLGGVDMEMSALFTVAIFRKVELGGVLVISDELFNLKWKPGFSSQEFKSAWGTALEIILRTASSL